MGLSLRLRLRQHLRCDGRQFDRGGFANLDRDADDRGLGSRGGFFRIGVSPVTGQPGDFRWRLFGAHRGVRKVAQAVQFVGTLEGGVDEKLPHFGLAIPIGQNPSAGSHRAGQRRARPVRRAQCQHQNQNGEKYAAHWKNAENRQHWTVNN